MEERGQDISVMKGHSGSRIPQRAFHIWKALRFWRFCWGAGIAREDSKLIASVADAPVHGL
jgi:hypothetical protein